VCGVCVWCMCVVYVCGCVCVCGVCVCVCGLCVCRAHVLCSLVYLLHKGAHLNKTITLSNAAVMSFFFKILIEDFPLCLN